MMPNSLCITHSYYARTASGGGKEGGGILYLKKIYDTGFGVYTLQDQRSKRISSY